MNCSNIKATLQDYIEHRLDEEKDESIRFHLKNCPDCNHEYQSYETLINLLQESNVPLPSADRWTSIHNSILNNLPAQQSRKLKIFTHFHFFSLSTPLRKIAAALVISVIGFSGLFTYLNMRSTAYPKVVAVDGNAFTIESVNSGTPIRISSNFTIVPGNSIQTDENSSLEIKVDHKSTIQLGNNSRCQVTDIAKKKRIFKLNKGDLEAKVSKRKVDELFRVETPNAYCEVIGTRFNVTTQYDNYFKRHITTLLVEEGTVEFGSPDHNMPVKAGYAVAIFGDSLGIPTIGDDTLIQLLRTHSGHGAFTITSTPEEADVFIDGDLAGQTPLFSHVTFGMHSIRISRNGFKDHIDSIEIKAHERFMADISLIPSGDGPLSPEDYVVFNDATLSRAINLLNNGNVTKAIRLLSSLVKNATPSTSKSMLATALYKLGTAYKLDGKYEAATLTLSIIVDGPYSTRERGKALFQRGTIHKTHLQNAAEAINDFRRYTSDFSKGIWYEEALYSLAELYHLTNDYKNAAKTYTAFINQFGNTIYREKVLFTLGILYCSHLSNIQRGISFYNRLLEEYPNSPYTEDALFWSADGLLRVGHSKKSAERFRSYLDRFPSGKWQSEATTRLSKILSAEVVK
jgi:TolA-binding protein